MGAAVIMFGAEEETFQGKENNERGEAESEASVGNMINNQLPS
jgi:hypothetical protein